MPDNSFKLSAELLQKNAAKSSIRDLNAEFQMKGGSVIYKTSKKGDIYLLSHPNENYLEEFRIRLFKELGLIEEKDLPKEAKEPKGEAPRYGEKHNLRRGWNVRSPKEFKEGRYDRGDRMRPEGETPDKPERRRPRGREHGRRSFDRRAPTSAMEEAPQAQMEGGNIKTFRERWPEVDRFMEIIEEALREGAVDDGQIIRYAYSKEIPEEDIRKLKKILWDNRCRGERENCPHGKKKFRFEDMMKVCSGKVDGWKNIDSPFNRFIDLWKSNMQKMYGEFKGKKVSVTGKISSYKPVYRKGHEHIKILVYDTMVKRVDEEMEPKETRKLWVKIGLKEFNELLGEKKLHLDDIISFRGKCIYDKYFHDYWVVDITEMDIKEEGGGEVISPPTA